MQQKKLFEDGSLSRPVAAALAATALVAPALASLSDGPSNRAASAGPTSAVAASATAAGRDRLPSSNRFS